MKRLYYADASDTPPAPPSNPSYGYPQDGNRSLKKLPTAIGSYWFHMITEEFMNVIEGAGLEPDEENLHQLADIFDDFRTRATASEQYKLAAEAAATRAETAATGVVTQTTEKIAEIVQAGNTQIGLIEDKEADVQAEIESALGQMQSALSGYISQLQAEGSSQSQAILQQAQSLLAQIQSYASQAQEAANTAVEQTREELMSSVVLTTSQELSESKKTQARSNIGIDKPFLDSSVEDYLVPIFKELVLKNGGTQADITELENQATNS